MNTQVLGEKKLAAYQHYWASQQYVKRFLIPNEELLDNLHLLNRADLIA